MPEDSSSPPESSPPAARRVSRLPRGLLALVQLALAFVILVSANYLSSTHHHTRDLTKHGDFTLSSLTTNLLRSELLTERQQPARIIMLVSRSSPHYARLRALVEEYARVGQEALSVEFVDPIHNTDRALELSDAYSHVILEEFFIIDATPAPADPPAEDEGEAPAPAPNGTKPAAHHLQFVALKDMLVFRNEPSGTRRLIGYRDEDVLSSALLAAAEGTPRRLYFLADKSQLQDASENTPWAVLRDNLRRQNILLEPLKLSEVEAIPGDAEGLALVAPQYDLDQREMGILQDYWNRPQAALLVLLDPAYRPRNLQAFLRQHGVRMRNDRIITTRNGRRLSDVPATFTFGPQLNQINTELRGKSTTFEGSTASLEVEENADRLINRRILPVPLIEASLRYWGETRYQEENPEFDPGEDTGPPLYLAAAVTRGNATSDETASQTSRMVVVSNVDFLHPNNQYREQDDFLTNSAHWLLNREDLIGVGPQPLKNYKLNLIPEQVSFVDRLNLFILPAAFLLVALLVANARRS